MTDSRAEHVVRRMGQLKAHRALHESLWQDIAELVRPMSADFTVRPTTPGRADRTSRIFDGTAGYAATSLASGIFSMASNSQNSWFELKVADKALGRRQDVKLWLAEASAALLDEFQRGGRRFYMEALGFYQDLPVFGTAVFYTDEGLPTPRDPRGGVRFRHRRLAENHIAENADGAVDTNYREFTLTARQAVEMFGDDAPKGAKTAVDKKEPDRSFVFAHAVEPNGDFDPRRMDWRGKPFVSWYVSLEDRALCETGGFRDFPYQVARWDKEAGTPYGWGPARLARPDIRMLNSMSKVSIVAAQKLADPPLLAQDEDAYPAGIKTAPGQIIYGGVDDAGRQMLQPLQTGANLPISLEMEERRRQQIRDAFHFNLLMMVRAPNMTATEVMERAQEQIRLMGPNLGRVEAEFLDPVISRTFDILYEGGAIPPAPEILFQAGEAGRIKVEYLSPLARAAKTAEAVAVQRTMEAVAPLAQVRPQVLDNFDVDEAARTIAEANGVPARVLRDPQAVAGDRARQAAAAQAQAEEAAAPGQARALKDAVGALQAAQSLERAP